MSDPWTRDQVRTLIELYKKHRCLYDPNSSLYRNKYNRMEALQAIAHEMCHVRPGTTANKIKMKLHCLRVQFHTNMRKYVANNCTDEAWWCFKDLMFLKDFVVLRKKMVDGLYDADDLELDFNSPDFGKVSQIKEEDFGGKVLANQRYSSESVCDLLPHREESPLAVKAVKAVKEAACNTNKLRKLPNLPEPTLPDSSIGVCVQTAQYNSFSDSRRAQPETLELFNLGRKSSTTDQQDFDGFMTFVADEFRRLPIFKKVELKKKILRAIIECQDD